MKSILVSVALVLALLLGGCSQIAQVVGNDLQRTQELGAKYGAPEIAQCAKYLQSALGEVSGLSQEKVEGLISLAVKAYLLKNQSASGEASFKKECGAFAAGVLLEAGKALPGIK